ncbi:MAG: hypothetical protein OXG78_13790 [Chloroflexi bacterium]|nr:hypothetical protein [Chloroflexota bacterium]
MRAAVLQVDDTCSLHDAIVAANRDEARGGCPAGDGADTILLTGDVTLTEELPVIESVISIEGDGYRISGDKRFRIFEVGERPFGSDDPGSEIKLTINRLVLRGSLGSAMYITIGAEVNIYHSRITDNFAKEGGAIFNWGRLNIAGSSFSNNLAWDIGGAIKNHADATLLVKNSTFSNNAAGNQGGAIFSSAPTTVRASSFLRNAALEGGAIFALRDELSVVNSTFSENTGATSGGALYLQESLAKLSHLTVYGSESRDGAGIFQDGGTVKLFNSIIGGSIEGEDCIGSFSENHGNLIEDGSCEPAFSGSPLLQPLSGSPAHYRLFGGSPAIHNGVVEYCARRDQLGNSRRWRYDCDIGAVEVRGDREIVSKALETALTSEGSNCTLADQIRAANRDETVGACSAGDGANTIHIDADITLKSRLPTITSEIIIIGNGYSISGEDARRIFDIGESGQLTIHNLNMIRGRHAIQGGAIKLRGGTLKISDSTIRDSHAGYGGAIYVEHGTLEIDNSELSVNSAHFGGGAIASEDRSSITVTDSRISHNVARSGGGLDDTSGTLTLVNSTVSHNSAAYGGAIYGYAGSAPHKESAQGTTHAIVDSVISHNTAEYYGGGINSSVGKLTISGSEFSQNRAGKGGGALVFQWHDLIVENSTFVGNVALNEGGALIAEGAAKQEVTNSTFSANSADKGGALWVGSITLTHVTIADNVANEAGGIALFSDVTLRNSIVAYNRGGDCGFLSKYPKEIDVTTSLIGDASCDAIFSGAPMLHELDGNSHHHPLHVESPAIDDADPEYCPATDQLGNPRPNGAGCDIGAIEYVGE